jgi:hypothetical protein
MDKWEYCKVFTGIIERDSIAVHFTPSGVKHHQLREKEHYLKTDFQSWKSECGDSGIRDENHYLHDNYICYLLSEGWEPYQFNNYGEFFKRKII